MSNWRVRHEGSPQAVEGLTLQQVAEGLAEGAWEPTDEVQGPGEAAWVAMENHPQLAEIAEDIEPPPQMQHGDETHLDFNALIDVCLVLLIFFILTTTYAALQKILESPDVSVDNPQLPVVTQDKVDQLMIQVTATQEAGGPVIRVEKEVVEPENLVAVLRRFVTGTKKTELLLIHSPDVSHGTVVAIQDAAKGAGMQKIHLVVPKEELGK